MITLLVPTMNRSDFLIRLIKYYQRLSFQGDIFIGDSSEGEHLAKNLAAVRAAREIRIQHRHYPGMSNAECISAMLLEITTPYAAFVADDDLLIPEGIRQCIDFLEANPDFAGAHGHGISFELNEDGAYGSIKSTEYYPQTTTNIQDPQERFFFHLTHYDVSLFCVARTDIWRKMYSETRTDLDKTFVLELIPCCLSTIYGKFQLLDVLYLARQHHKDRFLLPDVFDWVASPEWVNSYKYFQKRMTDALLERSRMDRKSVELNIKIALSSYLRDFLPHSKDEFRGKASEMSILDFVAHQIDRISFALRSLRRSKNEEKKKMFEIASLLKPTSPYHREFMNVASILQAMEARKEAI